MKVALVYPQEFKPNPYLDPDWEEPIGLGYLGAMAQGLGHKVRLFVPTTETLPELRRKIIAWKPDVVGMQLYTCMVPDGLAMAETIRKALPDVLIITGGAHPSALPNVLRESQIDLAVIGEGELTFQEILENCAKGSQDFSQISGLAYKDAGGRVVRTEPRKRMDPGRIRVLQEQATRLGPCLFQYQLGDPCSLFYPSPSKAICASEVGSRGCPHNCRFCSSASIWGQSCHWSGNPGDSSSLFQDLQQDWGVNLVFMEDLTFSWDKRWVEWFCKRLIADRKKINWWCQTTVRSVTPEILKLMRQAGCRTIAWGIEATDEESQRWMGTKQTLEETQVMLDKAAKLGIINWGYVVLGWPTQTLDAIWRNTMALRALNLHRIRLSIATPLPGSAWFSEFRPGELSNDWRLYDTDNLVWDHPHIGRDEIRKVRAEMFSQFYSSREYRERIERFTERFPELEQSFTEFFAYTMKFV